jgi:integrase-like protein
MYRLRRRSGLSARRRPMLRSAVTRGATVHRALRPNQVWSWDITYLPTVIRGRFLRLYLVMDVWSRRIVGWDVHDDERAERAATLIQRICADSGVDPHGLVLHSDNGKPMRGNTMIATLQWLGLSRPLAGRTCATTTRTLRRCFERSSTRLPIPVCPSSVARRPVRGSPALSAGTTRSIGTARFDMSRQTNDTSVRMSPSWRVVAGSMNGHSAADPSAGRVRLETGHRSPLWY